jgi:putative membrane protein
MMMDGLGMMLWGWFSFFLGVVLIFIFIVAVVATVKWLWGPRAPFQQAGGNSALDILRKRYAGGEISKEEFERVKKDVE